MEEFQRPEKKEKGGRGQTRKTSEDKKKTLGSFALCKGPKQKKQLRADGSGTVMAKRYTTGFKVTSRISYFYTDSKLTMFLRGKKYL